MADTQAYKIEPLELIQDKLKEALVIMDDKGRRGYGDSTYQLWHRDWSALRLEVYECLLIVENVINRKDF